MNKNESKTVIEHSSIVHACTNLLIFILRITMSTDKTANNKRIAKNTIALYIRMLLMMCIAFFTTREVLRILGVENFGIYNIVGGFIVLFVFINNSMTLATQRFLNFEIGKNTVSDTRRVFSASLSIHVIIAIVIALLAETIGLWFLNTYLNIPDNKLFQANVVYQLSLLSTLISIIRSPYNAAIIAYEKMDFFAYISVLESVLKLVIVYILLIFEEQALITYAALILGVTLLITFVYWLFCKISFPACRYYLFYDKSLYKSLLRFSGWSMFGSFANVGTHQGLNILLNMFFGVTVNAAAGVANQVSGAVYTFVSNFQTAFNPQLVKSYASNKFAEFHALIIRSSKFSFYLLWILSLPILICCEELLGIWLENVPPHSAYFCRLIIVFSLIDAIQGPLWMSVQATGKIKNYQLLMSFLILTNIPISYLFLVCGYPAEIVFVIRILVNVITSVCRVLYLKKHIGFNVWAYLRDVCVPCVLLVVFSLPTSLFRYSDIQGFALVPLVITVSVLCCLLFVYLIGLTRSERSFINNAIKNKILHK